MLVPTTIKKELTISGQILSSRRESDMVESYFESEFLDDSIKLKKCYLHSCIFVHRCYSMNSITYIHICVTIVSIDFISTAWEQKKSTWKVAYLVLNIYVELRGEKNVSNYTRMLFFFAIRFRIEMVNFYKSRGKNGGNLSHFHLYTNTSSFLFIVA